MAVPFFVFLPILVCAWSFPDAAFDDSVDEALSLLQVKVHLKTTGKKSEEDGFAFRLDFYLVLLSIMVLSFAVHRVGSKKKFSLKANEWVGYRETVLGRKSASGEKGTHKNCYSGFSRMLKHPSARMANKKLLDFIESFPRGLESTEAAQRVHQFLTSTQEWMLSESAIFVDIDDQGTSYIGEGLEKFVVNSLYPKIFASDIEDALDDQELQRHIGGLSWITFKHLGIPPVKPKLLKLAMSELKRMDEYKAPRDKLVCILNACRVINEVLRLTISEATEQGIPGALRPLSADDFLPLLIYTLIRTNPRRLHSNVEFVSTFRHPSRLVAEDAYFLTALQSAVFFIKEISHEKLDVTCEEFHSLYAESLASHVG